ERVERIGGLPAALRPADGAQRDRAPAAREDRGRLTAEEAVPRPLLPALHALEEKTVIAARRLEIRRDRRLGVREDLPIDRHQVAAARELEEIARARRVAADLGSGSRGGHGSVRGDERLRD